MIFFLCKRKKLNYEISHGAEGFRSFESFVDNTPPLCPMFHARFLYLYTMSNVIELSVDFQ